MRRRGNAAPTTARCRQPPAPAVETSAGEQLLRGGVCRGAGPAADAALLVHGEALRRSAAFSPPRQHCGAVGRRGMCASLAPAPARSAASTRLGTHRLLKGLLLRRAARRDVAHLGRCTPPSHRQPPRRRVCRAMLLAPGSCPALRLTGDSATNRSQVKVFPAARTVGIFRAVEALCARRKNKNSGRTRPFSVSASQNDWTRGPWSGVACGPSRQVADEAGMKCGAASPRPCACG